MSVDRSFALTLAKLALLLCFAAPGLLAQQAAGSLLILTVEELRSADLDDAAFAVQIPNLSKFQKSAQRRQLWPDSDNPTLNAWSLVFEAGAPNLEDLSLLSSRPGLHRQFAASGRRTFAAHRRFNQRDPHPQLRGFSVDFGNSGPFEWGAAPRKLSAIAKRAASGKGPFFGWLNVPWAGAVQPYYQGVDVEEAGGRRRAALVLFDRLLGEILEATASRAELDILILGLPGGRASDENHAQLGAREVSWPLLQRGPAMADWPEAPVVALHEVGAVARRALIADQPKTSSERLDPPIMWRHARVGGELQELLAFDGQVLVTINLRERKTITAGPSSAETKRFVERIDASLGRAALTSYATDGKADAADDQVARLIGEMRRGAGEVEADLRELLSQVSAERARLLLLEALRADIVLDEDRRVTTSPSLELLARALALRSSGRLADFARPYPVLALEASNSVEIAESLRALAEVLAQRDPAAPALDPELSADLARRVGELETRGADLHAVRGEAALARLQLGQEEALVTLRRAVLDPRAGRGRARFLKVLATRDPKGTRTLLRILLDHTAETSLRRAALDLVADRGWTDLDSELLRLAEGGGAEAVRAATILLDRGPENHIAQFLALAHQSGRVGARAALGLASQGDLLGTPWLPAERLAPVEQVAFETPLHLPLDRQRVVYAIAKGNMPPSLSKSELPQLFCEGRYARPDDAQVIGEFMIVRFLTPEIGPGVRPLVMRTNLRWRERNLHWRSVIALPARAEVPRAFHLLGADAGQSSVEIDLARGQRKIEAVVWWRRLDDAAVSVVLEASARGASPARIDLIDEEGRDRLELNSRGADRFRVSFAALAVKQWRVVIAIP